MGLRLFGSSSSYDDKPRVIERVVEKVKQVVLPNPDPKKFRIMRHTHIHNYLIVEVMYPDCTNFEGRKILVYENVDLAKLQEQGHIDPHFSNSRRFISPIARFVPTERGWDMAFTFVDNFRE